MRDIGKELDRYDDRIRKLHGSANFAQVYRGFRRDDLYARLADLTETARIRDKNIPSITHAIDRLIKPASPLVAHYRATPVVPPHPSKHGGKGLIDL